jgi:hypothetical protein
VDQQKKEVSKLKKINTFTADIAVFAVLVATLVATIAVA